MNISRRAVLASAFLALSSGYGAAESWPRGPITLVVNYAAGSATDITARAIASEAEKHLGVPIKIENRAGAQGTIGPTYLSTRAPDGETIGVTSFAPMAITPHLIDVSYEIADFEFIGGFARYTYGLAVPADSPFASVSDMVERAKAEPVVFGTTGPPNNLVLFNLGELTDSEFRFVPFESGAAAVTATIGNHLEAVVGNTSDMVPHISAGRLRLLASVSPIRWKEMPDVETLRELGYDVAIDSWLGLAVPAGVPQDRLEILRAAFVEAANSPDLKATLERLFMSPEVMAGPEFQAFLEDGYAQMGEALTKAGMGK